MSSCRPTSHVSPAWHNCRVVERFSHSESIECAMSDDAVTLEVDLAAAIVTRTPALPSEIRRLACEHIADFAGVAAAGLGSETFQRLSRVLAPRPSAAPGYIRVWGGA